MAALEDDQFVLLTKALESDFVPHLPPLLNKTKPSDAQVKKNLSRAFSAYALANICSITKADAAKAVVDDFDDYGIDAIYFHAPTDTLFVVQSKLKAAEQFSQEEALAYCQGVRKLIKQDFSDFNKNVQDRILEIEKALDNCSHIQLVVAHTGSGLSKHAKQAIDELLADEDHGEQRLESPAIDYDAKRVVQDLRAGKAYEKVNTELWIQKCSHVSEPRVTYFGLVQLDQLVALHNKHRNALYEKNIRTFLGHKTDVNGSIQQTLATAPENFLYLNNGVTALCQQIEPKGAKHIRGGKKLKIRGFSVINGAQTIASSAGFVTDNKGKDISAAKVSLTLVQVSDNDEFGKQVTQARNHQNPVHFSNFAALDDEQERLRRDLARLGIEYIYKAEAADGSTDPNRIRIDEAAQALAMFLADPRYVALLKKEPTRLLDTTSEQYRALFTPYLTAFRLTNAVRLNRYVQSRMMTESVRATGQERLAYKHGNYTVAWVLAKQTAAAVDSTSLFDDAKLKTELSAPFDQLRQLHWDKTRVATEVRGPLALFRNQTDVVRLLREVSIAHYALAADPAIEAKKKQTKSGQSYPEELFAYIASKAPQIGNLT